MKGWVVYDSEGAKRNAWFLQKLVAECTALGLDVEAKIFDAPVADIPLPQFAIVRTMNTQISEWLDGQGVRLFNNLSTVKTACDKWQTYLFCIRHDIPVLPTKLIEDTRADKVEGDLPPFDYPFVVKSRDGHGGSEVYLCKDKGEWDSLLSQIEKARFIAQPLADETGKDMRVYLLGGRVLAAMLRTSATDFRSNFSLGGKAQPCHPTNIQLAVLKKVSSALAPDFCGVDFIRHQGGWIVNEIEDPVGTRMLYEHTDIDAVKAFARHIYHQLCQN